ncbi:MAG: hypothetical protein JO304_18940 [Solirubrobacterales bacterium]|nr:hypothetical protein [Solirubrobacterales bacterium]
MLATGSAVTHATFVAQNSAVQLEEGKAEDYALVFIAPMDTPGKKLISRNSYESAARSAWDNPLSARFDENDAVVIFDEAFIPWENVLVYRDVKKATGFYAQSGFMPRYTLQSGTRLAVKLDFLCGLFARALRANGTAGFHGVQAKFGELAGWRNLIWALTDALLLRPDARPGRQRDPQDRERGADPDVRDGGVSQGARAVRRDPRRAPLVVPSSHRDLQNEELRPLIDRFYRGSTGDAHDRIKHQFGSRGSYRSSQTSDVVRRSSPRRGLGSRFDTAWRNAELSLGELGHLAQ